MKVEVLHLSTTLSTTKKNTALGRLFWILEATRVILSGNHGKEAVQQGKASVQVFLSHGP
jgi:hypothetical protein